MPPGPTMTKTAASRVASDWNIAAPSSARPTKRGAAGSCRGVEPTGAPCPDRAASTIAPEPVAACHSGRNFAESSPASAHSASTTDHGRRGTSGEVARLRRVTRMGVALQLSQAHPRHRSQIIESGDQERCCGDGSPMRSSHCDPPRLDSTFRRPASCRARMLPGLAPRSRCCPTSVPYMRDTIDRTPATAPNSSCDGGCERERHGGGFRSKCRLRRCVSTPAPDRITITLEEDHGSTSRSC